MFRLGAAMQGLARAASRPAWDVVHPGPSRGLTGQLGWFRRRTALSCSGGVGLVGVASGARRVGQAGQGLRGLAAPYGGGMATAARRPGQLIVRMASQSESEFIRGRQKRNNTVFMYVCAGGVLTLALAYAAVPLYRMFCQASGFAGTVGVDIDPEKVATMETVEDRVLKIKFNADTGATMRWKFKPLQKEVYLVPGETNLAFYSAENTTESPIIGISTYNVIPYDAGQYFMKIQCFCFEEQRLNPNEQVDMPVFFYIDPAFAEDPSMKNVHEITLSYTFFKSRDALEGDEGQVIC